MKRILTVLAIILLSASIFLNAPAPSASADQGAISVTSPSDQSGITTPKLLPGNPLYFFKEWGRAIKVFFAFDPVSKAAVKTEIANQRLAELRVLAQNNAPQKDVEKAADNYKKEALNVRDSLEKITDTIDSNPKLKNLVTSFAEKQDSTEATIQIITDATPSSISEQVVTEYRQSIEGRINSFKNCPLVSPPAPTFCPAGEVNPKKNYLGCVVSYECSSNTEDDSSSDASGDCIPACINIGTGSEGWYNPCDNELVKYATCKNCKVVCKNVGSKSEGLYDSCTGELLRFETCSQTPALCYQVYSPVCGANGKTYTNDCYAKAAGTAVSYTGECRPECQKDTDCPTIMCIKAPCPKNRCILNKCRLVDCTKDSDCIQPVCQATTPDLPECARIQCKNYKCVAAESEDQPDSAAPDSQGSNTPGNDGWEPQEGSAPQDDNFQDTGQQE